MSGNVLLEHGWTLGDVTTEGTFPGTCKLVIFLNSESDFFTQVNVFWKRNVMTVVLVEVNVSGLTRREVAPVLLTLDRRVSVIDRDVIRHRIVPSVDLAAHRAHESAINLLYVLFVSAPSLFIIVRHYLLQISGRGSGGRVGTWGAAFRLCPTVFSVRLRRERYAACGYCCVGSGVPEECTEERIRPEMDHVREVVLHWWGVL